MPATTATVRAGLAGSEALAAHLGAVVPASWPPEFLDAESLQFTIDRLHEGPRQAGWWLHFVLVPSGQTDRTLIHPRMDPLVRARLRELLLTLHEVVRGREILTGIGVDRFVAPDPPLYAPVREMAERVERP